MAEGSFMDNVNVHIRVAKLNFLGHCVQILVLVYSHEELHALDKIFYRINS